MTSEYPETIEGWIDRLNEMMGELTPQDVQKAYDGSQKHKALIEAWAVELQAALMFISGYAGALNLDYDALVDSLNTITDTIQAILLALAIVYLLKKFKRKGKSLTLDVVVSKSEALKELGDRTSPIPSRPDADSSAKSAYLYLRIAWVMHFILTLLQSLALQEAIKLNDGEELVWVSRKDSKVCSICRYMDGKKSINGDFLPVILKKFTTYIPYVDFMIVPHAHPRCRCIAVPEKSKAPDIYNKEQTKDDTK